MRFSDLPAYLSLNCLLIGMFLMLFCSNSAHFSESSCVTDRQTDGWTDGRTHPFGQQPWRGRCPVKQGANFRTHHYGRKWTRTQTKWPSNHSLSHERTDERVAQYFRLDFWLIWPIVRTYVRTYVHPPPSPRLRVCGSYWGSLGLRQGSLGVNWGSLGLNLGSLALNEGPWC